MVQEDLFFFSDARYFEQVSGDKINDVRLSLDFIGAKFMMMSVFDWD